jgi:peptide/nickel transport system substrate-binding protein
MGILPQHIWQNVTDEQFPFSDVNVKPVGSGPFSVSSVKRDSSGIPTTYTLSSFRKYALGQAYISKFILHFYQNEADALDAYKAHDIESISGLSATDLSTLKPSGTVEETTLPEVFGVFFNQNQQTLFTDAAVRRALDEAIDRQQIVESVFSGHAAPLSGPIPPGIIDSLTQTSPAGDLDAAAALLAKDGWTKNSDGILQKKIKKTTQTLAFSISTANVPELRATAELMKETWEKLGASVDVKIFEPGDLNQNVIRPRKYDALLFGEIVGRELDLYAFWHSSQRNDPGLNIAMYVNSRADKALEDLRKTSDPEDRTALYQKFASTVSSDTPAVFAYAPDFIYVLPKSVKGVTLGVITTPSERFIDAYRWYIESDRVWSFFIK